MLLFAVTNGPKSSSILPSFIIVGLMRQDALRRTSPSCRSWCASPEAKHRASNYRCAFLHGRRHFLRSETPVRLRPSVLLRRVRDYRLAARDRVLRRWWRALLDSGCSLSMDGDYLTIAASLW